MVRLIWIQVRGRLVQAEDHPDVCPDRHEAEQRPTWGPCPACGRMLRLWTCGQCGAQSVDDEHRCPGPPKHEREIQRRGG